MLKDVLDMNEGFPLLIYISFDYLFIHTYTQSKIWQNARNECLRAHGVGYVSLAINKGVKK